MFRHVLIPTDGSEVGAKAILEGIDLAKTLGAKVTVLTVVRPFHTFSLDPEMVTETSEEHRQHEDEHLREDIRLAKKAASAAGLACEHVKAEHDHLSDAVIHAARSHGCDLVVMPAHDRAGLLTGSHVDSATVRLLARSELPVLVLH
jgi:nucleotide-binding universal stress UspA family protein